MTPNRARVKPSTSPRPRRRVRRRSADRRVSIERSRRIEGACRALREFERAEAVLRNRRYSWGGRQVADDRRFRVASGERGGQGPGAGGRLRADREGHAGLGLYVRVCARGRFRGLRRGRALDRTPPDAGSRVSYA